MFEIIYLYPSMYNYIYNYIYTFIYIYIYIYIVYIYTYIYIYVYIYIYIHNIYRDYKCIQNKKKRQAKKNIKLLLYIKLKFIVKLISSYNMTLSEQNLIAN